MRFGSFPLDVGFRPINRFFSSVFWTIRCSAATPSLISLIFIRLFSLAASTVTGFVADIRTKVAIGAVGSRPVKAVNTEIFPRWGDGALLKALWTRGRMYVHSVNGICSSDNTDGITCNNSRPSRLTESLLHRLYGSEKWCGTLSTFEISRTVSFRKCVGPSDINTFGTTNAAHK